MSEKILKPFAVTIEYTAIVMAESEIDAYTVAHDQKRDIESDCDAEVSTGHELTREDQLSAYGWDGQCLPYGGDGETRLRDIFIEIESRPVADTKTIDMFAGIEPAAAGA
jgi:hypothetical protein